MTVVIYNRLPGRGFNPSVPRSARVYGCLLNSKDNYAADRRVAEAITQHYPDAPAAARANRAFLGRTVRHALTDLGIRQILDIGTGLPSAGSALSITQQLAPDCRIVHADNDPVVLSHGRALASPGQKGCEYVYGDARDPADILRKAAATLHFDQPVAVLLLAVLHYIADSDDPAGLVASLSYALAPGSLIVISHLTADLAPGPVTAATAAYNAAMPIKVYPRSHRQVTELFGGLRLQWPGVAPATKWLPSPSQSTTGPCAHYGAVAQTISRPGVPLRGGPAGARIDARSIGLWRPGHGSGC